jgi:DNA invertase Pin-like site-specific DNA recombinase
MEELRTAGPLKVAAYTRVSTPDQNPELQLQELRDYAERQRWDVVESYQDVISGAKARRPGLDCLMADARLRKFDCVLVWKLDRFGRSLVDCLNRIQALESCGVRFIAVTQGLDTDQRNPASRLLLTMLGATAEFERSLIVERSQAGQARYRRDYEAGKVGKSVHSRSGKNLPPHRPRRIFDRDKVCMLREQGFSLRQIAERMDLGLGTVTRTLEKRSKSS